MPSRDTCARTNLSNVARLRRVSYIVERAWAHIHGPTVPITILYSVVHDGVIFLIYTPTGRDIMSVVIKYFEYYIVHARGRHANYFANYAHFFSIRTFGCVRLPAEIPNLRRERPRPVPFPPLVVGHVAFYKPVAASGEKLDRNRSCSSSERARTIHQLPVGRNEN